MKQKQNEKICGESAVPDTAWPQRGASVFACGEKDGVVSRACVERADIAGISFFSERAYAAGEEVGVQFDIGMGNGEFGARMLKGIIKGCRAVKSAGAVRRCRAEAGWISAAAACHAAL